jgi:hypothetical protein
MSEYTYCYCGYGWDASETAGKHDCHGEKCPCNGIPGAMLAGVPHYPGCFFNLKKPSQQKQEPGTKFDSGKPRMELLSSEALIQIALVLNEGAKKYSDNNWRKGMSWSRLLGAAMRHLTSFKDGEDLDKETGLSHLAHLGCCTMFLLEYIKTHPEMDDRYKVIKNDKE